MGHHIKRLKAKWQPKTRRSLRHDDSGAVLVEFALVLPLLLVVFGVVIEGSRMMKSYQSVTSGVRDATRFLARVAPLDVCSSGESLAGFNAELQTIVANSLGGQTLLQDQITVTSVTSSLTCTAGNFRISPSPSVVVTANLEIQFPFSGLFEFFGDELGTVNTTVSDQQKVFGT